MNSHALTSEISAAATSVEDRRLMPRSQLGRTRKVYDATGQLVGVSTSFYMRVTKRYQATPYRFEIGQQVQWGDEVWIVAGRETSAVGRRFYTVTREGDERPVRTVIEVALAPIA